MEPSREAISVRLARLRSQLAGASAGAGAGSLTSIRRALHREALLDALTTLYDECNNDALKKQDEHIAKFVDKYRCVLTELSRMRVNVDDFEVKELIGRGHFGEVHVVREKLTGDVYAMKRLRKDDTLHQHEVAFYEEERDIMALAVSPWITRLQYAFQDSSHLYLVMEFCPGGDLAGLLERRAEPLSLADAAFYVAQLNQALNALHTCGFLHRDVKPDNVLIDRCGHLKLADFGSAVRIGQSGRATSRVPVGTPDYIAPELLAAAENTQPTTHGAAVDYWSLGVVAYELVTLRTPFSDRNKASAAHTFGNIQRYREGRLRIPWPADGPSEEYRELVACLLRVEPGKRYNYLETLRHPALKDMSWNTIRDQVPPFVPLVRSTDDTSHFSECAANAPRAATAASLRNFRSKTAFSGNNLPFIGFTFTPESYVCCAHGSGDSTSSSSGFNSSSINNTAVHLASFREVEKLAERRGAEIAALQQRAAQAESEAVLQRERERHLTTLEQQRTKLEHEVTELIVHNQRLSRQLEMEHEERNELERKSLELIETAKRKWVERHRAQTEELRAQLATRDLRLREQRSESDSLRAKVEELNVELKRTAAEMEAMRKLQVNYKDSMAKARAASRASLAGLAEPGAELAREREARRAADAQLARSAERLKRAEDTETALRVELAECRKDYADLQERFTSHEAEQKTIASEAASVERRAAHGERRAGELEKRVAQLEQLLAAEKRDSSALKANIAELSERVAACQRRESALEEQHARTAARLQDKLAAAQQGRAHVQAQLDAANHSDTRHRDKVSELECLVMKLEREVSKLEVDRGGGGGRGGGGDAGGAMGAGAGAEAQVQLLKEQLAASEQQLQATRDELHTLKQESRKTSTALWKKEKELSDSELDRRIVARELKAAEERAARGAEARRAAAEAAAAERARLEAAAAAAAAEAEAARAEAARAQAALRDAEARIAELRERAEARGGAEERLGAEIDRYKNDMRKLKCELQYSENRRLRAEASVDREKEELRRLQDERLQLHEEAAGLRAALDERTRAANALQENNKLLQEACSMLEEQLVDLERLSDLHENKSNTTEAELARVRSELEQCRCALAAAESRAAEQQQRAGSAARQQGDVEAHAHRLQRQLDDLQDRMREKESRYSALELTEAATAAERDALQRKLCSAGQRLQQLQEESSALLTSTHQLTADNMRLQHQLREAQEEVAAAREASEAATAWWRTRETKADATLRQQAKLIDFLQSKVEELSRKKKTLGDMLFGSRSHSTKESAATMGADATRALVRERKSNRELREELTKLKSELPANSAFLHGSCPPTKVEKKKPVTNGFGSSPERVATSDEYIRIIREGEAGSERVAARAEGGALVWRAGGAEGEVRARLLNPTPERSAVPATLDPLNCFTMRTVTCPPDESSRVTVACSSAEERARWLARLAAPGAGAAPARGLGYAPRALLSTDALRPTCVLEPRSGLYAIGTETGLYSYRSGHAAPVRVATPGLARVDALRGVPQAARLLLLADGALHSADARAFLSVLEQAAFVAPALHAERVPIAPSAPPARILALEVMSRQHSAERAVVCVSTGRRMMLLTCDAASGWRTLRSLDLPTAAHALLFTPHTVLIAADRLYELDLQRYTVEEFLDASDATLATVLRERSRPRAVLAVRDDPEYLVCYAELGIFVDEFGRRTRSEDVLWSGEPIAWSFRKPYLFVVQADRVEVAKIDDCSYRLPPCQCDSASVASGASECAIPDKCTVNLQSPIVLGKSMAAGALLLREGAGRSCSIVEIDGTRALRKIGVSVETLQSAGSLESLHSTIEVEYSEPTRAIDEPDRAADSDNESTNTEDISADGQTDFLADIRRRARQIRTKMVDERRKEEAIRQILSTEVTGKFVPRARRNSVESADSEFSVASSEGAERGGSGEGPASDSATECHVVGRTTADICNDIFLRKQVRFDK